jgi:hypothetical protein
MDYSMMQGPPMAPGVANAAQGQPSAANPGGLNNHSWEAYLQSFQKVDLAIRGLRAQTLMTLPGAGKIATGLDKLAYDLGRLRGDAEQNYAQEQSNQMAQQAAQMMSQG